MKRVPHEQLGVLYKSFDVKVFLPGNKACHHKRFRGEKGTAFSAAGIRQILRDIAVNLRAAHPKHIYQLIELSPTQFNFVWQGEEIPVAAAHSPGG